MSDHAIGKGSTIGYGHKSSGSALTTTPFPASRKVYVQGTQAGVRVPMREISLTATKSMNGGTPSTNEPITIYDTSGPYTDQDIQIDARSGLAPYRRDWVTAGTMWTNSPMSPRTMAACVRSIPSWTSSGSSTFASHCEPSLA